MAQRRMFSKLITNSSEFLMMSQSAQNLYFHFGMNADDDGFCEVFTIMRMTDSKPDDLQSLHSRGFIFVVDNKVCIIKDWHENNQLRLDRYKQSAYLTDENYVEVYKVIMTEKVKEIGLYKDLLNGKPNGNQMAPQVRIGKVRIGKEKKNTATDKPSRPPKTEKRDPNEKKTLEDFITWCRLSKQKHIHVIAEWAEAEQPKHTTRGQWESYIKRNLRAAQELVPYPLDKIEKAYNLMLKDVKTIGSNGKTTGFITKYTLETITKYIDLV
jgi:hypothetical protein